MLSAKISREFKNSGTSTPSIDTFRPSRDPYRSFRSQLNIDGKILAAQGYCVAIVILSLL